MPGRRRFVADPVADGAVLSLALGVGLMSEIILGTGEITPQQPRPQRNLLSIDRGVIEATPIPAWGTISNVGFGMAIGYAVVDPVFSGYRDGVEAGLVDAVIYAETISVTWAVTNLTKIAVRRPRPSAYQEQARLNPDGGEEIPVELDTNSALSFFSGHASITASVAAAATYLAFARSDEPVRPWLTLGMGTVVTALTSIGRVKSGKHFPTDVIAGAMAGAGIGVLVPHLHREAPAKQRRVWIGFGTLPGGAAVQLYGPL